MINKNALILTAAILAAPTAQTFAGSPSRYLAAEQPLSECDRGNREFVTTKSGECKMRCTKSYQSLKTYKGKQKCKNLSKKVCRSRRRKWSRRRCSTRCSKRGYVLIKASKACVSKKVAIECREQQRILNVGKQKCESCLMKSHVLNESGACEAKPEPIPEPKPEPKPVVKKEPIVNESIKKVVAAVAKKVKDKLVKVEKVPEVKIEAEKKVETPAKEDLIVKVVEVVEQEPLVKVVQKQEEVTPVVPTEVVVEEVVEEPVKVAAVAPLVSATKEKPVKEEAVKEEAEKPEPVVTETQPEAEVEQPVIASLIEKAISDDKQPVQKVEVTVIEEDKPVESVPEEVETITVVEVPETIVEVTEPIVEVEQVIEPIVTPPVETLPVEDEPTTVEIIEPTESVSMKVEPVEVEIEAITEMNVEPLVAVEMNVEPLVAVETAPTPIEEEIIDLDVITKTDDIEETATEKVVEVIEPLVVIVPTQEVNEERPTIDLPTMPVKKLLQAPHVLPTEPAVEHIELPEELEQATEEMITEQIDPKSCTTHQYFSSKKQRCAMLNKAQCKLLGRLFLRDRPERKGYCTSKCRDQTMMVQGSFGQCKTVRESVIDVLRKVTGDRVDTVFEETLNISRANEVAVQTLSLANEAAVQTLSLTNEAAVETLSSTETNDHHDAGVAAVISNADYYGDDQDWPDSFL